MRGFAALWAALLLALPGQVRAEVAVRSGEHPGFSRLVLEFPAPTDWELEPHAGGFEIRTPGRRFDFDLSRVFHFIPRTRVTSLTTLPEGAGLRAELRCDCPIEGFVVRGRAVVVDVMEAPARESGARQWQPGLLSDPPQLREAHRLAISAFTDVALVSSASAPEEPRTVATFWQPASLIQSAMPSPLPTVDPPSQISADEDLLRDLTAALAAGATSGALTPSGSREPVQNTVLPEPAALASIGVNIGVSDGRRPEGRLPVIEREVCRAAAVLPPRQGIEPGTNREEMWRIAEAMIARADPETEPEQAAKTLAAAYLSLGFGAEAFAALRNSPDSDLTWTILAAAAMVADRPSAAAPDIFSRISRCGGGALLWWAAASRASFAALSPDELRQVRVALARTSPALRSHFGFRLADFAVQEGRNGDAVELLSSLVTVETAGQPQLRRLLDRASGDWSGAMPVKASPEATLARSDGAEVLAERLAGQLEHGFADPRDLEHALLFSRERKGSALGDRLAALRIHGLADAGAFVAAARDLDEARRTGRLLGPLADDVLAELTSTVLDGAADDPFIIASAMLVAMPGFAGIDDEIRARMSQRLTDLGLPGVAADVSGREIVALSDPAIEDGRSASALETAHIGAESSVSPSQMDALDQMRRLVANSRDTRNNLTERLDAAPRP